MIFPLQWPHPWNYISPSGEWKWTLVDANRRALTSSRVKSRTVSASDVWARPMHKTLFLAFQIASTARILCLKPCALDPLHYSGGLFPPWSRGLEFGGRARGHGEWAVFTFSPSIAWASLRKFSGPVFSRLSYTQPESTGHRFLRVRGYFIYRGLRLWGLRGRVTRRSPA